MQEAYAHERMSATGQPPSAPKKKEKYYLHRLSEFGRRLFDLGLGAIFFYVVEWVIHTLMRLLGVDDKIAGFGIRKDLEVACIVAYLIYVAHLLIPDASEQLAKAYTQVKSHWKRSPTRKHK